MYKKILGLARPCILFSFKVKSIAILIFSLKTYFDNFDFKCTLFSKSVPNFLPSKPKKDQRPRMFLYTPSWSWGQVYSSLNSTKLSCSSGVTLRCHKNRWFSKWDYWFWITLPGGKGNLQTTLPNSLFFACSPSSFKIRTEIKKYKWKLLNTI